MSSASGRKNLAEFLGSEFLNENTCQPCYTEGRQLEAIGFCTNCQEHLCEECFEYHTKPSLTKNHVLIQRKQSLKNTIPTTRRKRSFSFKSRIPDKCHEHPDKSIKYFCPGHDYLGCSICMTLTHRHCEDMEYIPDTSKKITSSEELKDVENNLQQIVEDSKDIMHAIQKRSAETENYNRNALKAVANYKKEIYDTLNQLEDKINEKLKQIKEEELHELNQASRKCTDAIKEAELILQQFKILREDKQYCSMYIALKNAKESLGQLKDSITTAQKQAQNAKKAQHYTFKPTTEILEQLRSFQTLGNLVLQDTKVNSLIDINVRSESDTTECWISGMAVLPKNKLVVADRNNRKIKVLDTKENSILIEAQLESRPWDVAKVHDTQVVISLPNKKRLVFMNTDPTLSNDHELSMTEPCYGVAYTNTSLIVTYAGQHKVDILDLQGNLLKSFTKGDEGQQIFYTPCYIDLSPNQQILYVSNSGNDSLVSLTLDGNVAATFVDSDVKFLRQSVVDELGMVYVCEVSGNVHQLTADCQKVTTIFTKNSEKIQPFSISYDVRAQKFFIGMEKKDTMKVLQLKYTTI